MSLSSSTVGGKIKYKIVLLGDQHVGKTSIIDKFINDRFQTTYNSTIGIDFLVRNLTYQNKSYRLQLWDTAGQQRFKSLIPSYLKDSDVCLLVYDTTCLKTLENAQKWLQLYNENKEHSAFSVLVGNKKDMPNKQCTPEIVEQIIALKDMPNFVISAKTGEGVTTLFYDIIDLIGKRSRKIKIINGIDEKEDQKQTKQQKEEQVQDGGGSAKPTLQEFNQIKLTKSIQFTANHKRCC